MTQRANGPGDLTACDTEPIHIPGSIQPAGVLLALSRDNWQITHASENADTILEMPFDRLVGLGLIDAVGREFTHRVTNALTSSPGPTLPGRAFGVSLPGGALVNIAVHKFDGRILLEFEAAVSSRDDTLPLLLVRAMLTQMQQAQTTVDICEAAVEQLRALIGFDRVMVYQFLADGSGFVIAEAKRDDVESFLGHHYPATDIPLQARALYIKNWIRTIADVDAVPVPIFPRSKGSEKPIDLSFCSLRSVSPIHLEYLRNMGVAASMSISIVMGGKLWGLIACHHHTPRQVAAETRVAAELFGQAFSLQLHAIERLDATEVLRDARARLDKLVAELPDTGSLLESLSARLREVATILPCDGAGLWVDGEWRGTGVVPPLHEIPALANAVTRSAGGEIFATHELSAVLPEARKYADQVSGVLAVPLSRTPGDYLMFFRREYVHDIEWAGNPQKENGLAERLSPRKSFEIWREEVRNKSTVWESSDRLAAEALRITLLEVVLRFSEVIAVERARSAEQQRMFARELNHRIKNALALVGALVKQSRGGHQDISLFVSDLEARILSLAKAHDLANATHSLDLRFLIETELAPFNTPGKSRIRIDGPTVVLGGRTFAVLALVIHEMTTNAAKHGALSVHSGSIEVRWTVDEHGSCAMLWTEAGGPPVTPPAVTGFGTTLIKRQIPFELEGQVHVNYEPDGVRILLRIPPQHLTVKPSTPAIAETPAASPIQLQPGVLAGVSFLLLEDSLLVALQAEDTLRKAGAQRITICSTAQQALDHLAIERPHFAILDVNLTEGTSIPIADALTGARIPFIFVTGDGAMDAMSGRLARVEVLRKPYDEGEMVTMVQRALRAYGD